MRARNIKPGFFKNEEIADMPFSARLLFIGLWGLADRLGRLADRPKRIKAEVFAYDNLNIEKMLNVIACHGFIVRYEANNNRYIQIVNFTKHQFTHPHEPKSTIPECNDMTCNVHLNPGVMNTDVMNPDIPAAMTKAPQPAVAVFDFEKIWKQYPKRLGRKNAERHFRSSVKSDVDFVNIKKALANYLQAVSGKEVQYIQHGSTWFNNWRDWIEYREEKNYATNGGTSHANESAFIQRIREAKGLRKTEFQGPTGQVLAGIRNMQADEEQGGESIGEND